jgi:type IV pilus assembly protein PilW
MCQQNRSTRSLQRGFGIVEMLVAAVVGMLAVAAITAVFWSSEGQKRTITRGADASENALIALAMMERDLRMAGLGLMEIGCTVVNGFNAKTGATFSFNPVPVTITRDAPAAGSDTVELVYSAASFGTLPTQLSSPMSTPGADLQLMNGQGFAQGNVILVSEGSKPCSLVQASAAPTRSGFYWNIVHNVDDAYPFNNPPAASFPATGYQTGAIVVNMGPMVRRQYFIQNGHLMQQDMSLPVSTGPVVNPVPIADGIVTVRAQYGRDTDGDGYINVFDVTPPASARDVIAIKVAVVARSGQLEKTAVSPATIALWSGGTVANGGAIALDATAQQYRYKVYQTTIPLRNVIWGDN